MTRTTMTDRTSRETKMRLFSLVRVAVLGALLSGASVARAAPDSVATIKALVEQGQFERAYDHALAAEARYEGDPEFDFYFGLAAIEVGRYPDAIFAFERVVFAQPDQLRVRLELARPPRWGRGTRVSEASNKRNGVPTQRKLLAPPHRG